MTNRPLAAPASIGFSSLHELSLRNGPEVAPPVAKHTQCLVVGCGPAGQSAALRAAELGIKVTVIDERLTVGGVCVHTGTIPSKAAREAALQFLQSPRSEPFSMQWLRDQVSAIQAAEVEVIKRRFDKAGIEFVGGKATFLDDGRALIRGGPREAIFDFDKCILAVGTEPRRPSFAEFDPERVVMTSDEILSMDRLPQELVIVGGGIIGCEYGSIFAALGSKVTIVESRDALMSEVDVEIADEFKTRLEEQGIVVKLKAKVDKVCRGQEGRGCVILGDGTELKGDRVLVSAGRQRLTDGLGLQNLGIIPEDRGRVVTDTQNGTKNPKVFAAGDVMSVMALASVAAHDGRLAASAAFHGRDHAAYPLLPSGIYAIPEIGYVGKSQQQLLKEGIPFVTGYARHEETGRGIITGLTRKEKSAARKGMLKMLVHEQSGEILGVHVIGYSATELVHIGQAYMQGKLNLEDVKSMVHNYPTYAELYREAALDASHKLEKSEKQRGLVLTEKKAA